MRGVKKVQKIMYNSIFLYTRNNIKKICISAYRDKKNYLKCKKKTLPPRPNQTKKHPLPNFLPPPNQPTTKKPFEKIPLYPTPSPVCSVYSERPFASPPCRRHIGTQLFPPHLSLPPPPPSSKHAQLSGVCVGVKREPPTLCMPESVHMSRHVKKMKIKRQTHTHTHTHTHMGIYLFSFKKTYVVLCFPLSPPPPFPLSPPHPHSPEANKPTGIPPPPRQPR